MSEIKKKLLEPVITKKQVIWIIVIASVLVTSFAFSSYFFSLVLGTQRDEPSDELDKAEHEDAKELTPHFPIDLDDLLDWLEDDYDLADLQANLDDLEDLGIDISDISPEDLQALLDEMSEEEIEQFIENMMDGDIDNYDLATAGLVIAALLFSNVEVFRVYEYFNPIQDREDILWKYESFDQFNRYEWVSTVPMEQTVYPDDPLPLSDVNKIQRPLSVIQSSNSMVLGSRFNELVSPSILRDSIVADNLDQVMYFYDELGCSSVDLDFDLAGDVNMTYYLFGTDLRTNDEINQTAEGINQNPAGPDFQKFLQLPGGVSNYINDPGMDDFKAHRDILAVMIDANDNAFMVANKIRNYLQLNFDLNFDALVNYPPGDTEDIVEWFCEHGEGMYSEFASAFVAFARSFGVGARFIDGFNSRLIEEFNDEKGDPYYPIKYKNIYNWAEVFVPWGPGTGRWVQMDILYDSFGPLGAPIEILEYNLSVSTNFSKSQTYKRGQFVNITAVLDSDTEPINQKTIIFTDITSGNELNRTVTNNLGIASIIVNVSDDHIVGPNVIKASYQNVENYTYYVIDGDVFVNVTLTQQEVNVSESPHTTTARGYIEDATTSQKIQNSYLNFSLFNDGTSTPVLNSPALPFDPDFFVYTDSNGEFDLDLTVNDIINYGEYDFRVDFNGYWGMPIKPYYVDRPNINASSNIIDFNVTKELSYDLFFYIKNRPTECYNKPLDPATLISVKRNEDLRMSVIVEDEITHNTISGIEVTFYDYTNNILIGSNFTNSKGNASRIYTIGDNHQSGPTLVYVGLGSKRNYSYFIVNESIDLKINPGPSPREIELNLASSDQFKITGAVNDSKGNDIGFTEIKLNLFNEIGSDYTSKLVPLQNSPYITGNDGNFNLDFRVDPNTPIGNYTLRIDFNGSFILTNDLNNKWAYDFTGASSLDYLSNSSIFEWQLKVIDPYNITIFLKVDGDPTPYPNNYDDDNKPRSYIRGVGQVNFEIWINQSGSAVESGHVTLLDVYTNDYLFNYTFTGAEPTKGYKLIVLPTSRFYYAGIHKIEVQYMNFPTFNYTFIIINETVNFDPNRIINVDNEITRDIESFVVSGYVRQNGTALNGLTVRIVLLDLNNVNYTSFLIGTKTATTNTNGYFEFDIDYINRSCPQGPYFIRIDFNGSIYVNDIPGIDPIIKFMVENSSLSIPLNVTAGTNMTIFDYYTTMEFYPLLDKWVNKSILTVIGDLLWDNKSSMNGMFVNVTVQLLDGTIIAYNDTEQTNPSGRFTANLLITDAWPDLRSETKIVVYFDSKIILVEDSNDTAYP